jgi:hypothetical protein
VHQDPWVDLQLNAETFLPGDRFLLTLLVANPAEALEVDLYVILDVYGVYYFFPDWTTELAAERRSLPAGSPPAEETILDFTWPPSTGQTQGLAFWAALLDPATGRLVSNVDQVTFGYGG